MFCYLVSKDRLTLPVILFADVQSLNNKSDKLHARLAEQPYARHCSLLQSKTAVMRTIMVHRLPSYFILLSEDVEYLILKCRRFYLAREQQCIALMWCTSSPLCERPKSYFGKSDHLAILLKPTYTKILKTNPVMANLKSRLELTDMNVFKEATYR